jgi:DNA-binding transcriptional regulator YiaG
VLSSSVALSNERALLENLSYRTSVGLSAKRGLPPLSRAFATGINGWEAVGRRVRELRSFEIVQAQFAHELGISQGQLSRYEQGKSEIGAEILLRLARRSGRTIEWLLTGKDSA